MEGEEESLERCLEKCSEGLLLQRVKSGRLTSPSRVFIQGGKYFCYRSTACWKLLPVRLKSDEIDDLFEVRRGYRTDTLNKLSTVFNFRQNAPPERCFSVLFYRRYRRGPMLKTLDFVAASESERNMFAVAMENLTDKKKVEKLTFDEQRWVAENFELADTNKNGVLSFQEIWALLNKLNLEMSEQYARQLFLKADTAKADRLLTKEEFVKFFESLTERPDLRILLRQHGSQDQEAFTTADLREFLTKEQQFDDVDERKATLLVETYETAKQENRKDKLLGLIGLERLLHSRWGNILKPGHEAIFQDMDLPLPCYFVNSSHNTYLTGLQFTGEATVEGYIIALRKGARLLELDLHDGAEGMPCVTHKRTMIQSITLRDVLKAIDENAFRSSPYPVILTIENHTSLPQQQVMAELFQEILGDKLYISPADSATRALPSPNFLKNKFLLRGKKSPGTKSDDSNGERDSRKSKKQHESIELHPEYSRLISLPSVKLSSNIYEDAAKHPLDGSPSLSESKVLLCMEAGSTLPYYTSSHLAKSYPKGIRQDSSNMDPVPSWMCGVQSVALNLQTADESTDLNRGFFYVNGNCGYVLKPEVLLKGIDPRQADASREKTTLTIMIISGQYLPKPTRDEADIVDPYVSVEIYGIAEDTRKMRTVYIHNNGFNPQWRESFDFVLRRPELALLRLCVKDHDTSSEDDFIGEYTVPVSSLRPGYSHVRLYTGRNHTLSSSASIFIRALFH